MNKPINIDKNCQFLKDLKTPPNFMNMPLGLYNLNIFIRDLELFCKGIKPHKKWRLKDARFTWDYLIRLKKKMF